MAVAAVLATLMNSIIQVKGSLTSAFALALRLMLTFAVLEVWRVGRIATGYVSWMSGRRETYRFWHLLCRSFRGGL